ncbi:MAG: HD domain-containing phosphohydrolase [Burkholderiales bacterium]
MPASLLCVDDEPNILNALRRLFRPQGYRILVANSGAEGLAQLEREPIDVVISDMRMPEMSGAEFLEKVRGRWPDSVRILLTGYSEIESTVAAINAGQIARYVSKPWNDDEMLLIVREALERKNLIDDKQRLEVLARKQNEELKTLNATLEQKVETRTAQLAAALKTVEAGRAAMHRGLLNSVRVFAGFIDLRHGPLAAHGKRVAERARALAQQLGQNAAQAQDIAIAALVHDLGMLSLSDNALATPARALAGAELEDYLKHPARGADLLAAVDPLRGAAELIRAHHERFDGGGFPKGSRGSEICIGARILAVADDYDELVAGMQMRTPMPPANAMAYLLEGRGRRYDPVVVDAYVALYGGAQAAAPPREVVLRCAQLEPGMVLARDIVAPDGKLLLAGDYALDAELIDGLIKHERAGGAPLQVTVRVLAPVHRAA